MISFWPHVPILNNWFLGYKIKYIFNFQSLFLTLLLSARFQVSTEDVRFLDGKSNCFWYRLKDLFHIDVIYGRRVIIIRYSIDEKRTTYTSLLTFTPVNAFHLEFQSNLKTKILFHYVLLTYLVHAKFWHVVQSSYPTFKAGIMVVVKFWILLAVTVLVATIITARNVPAVGKNI